MSDSAFEAIYTGVYIFVFIAALTIALYMFRNINELAENSYEYGIEMTSGTLIQDTEQKDRLLEANDVISYYYNYVDYDISDYKNVHVTIKDENGTIINSGVNYNNLKGRLGNVKYRIKCIRVDTNGEYYFEIYKA